MLEIFENLVPEEYKTTQKLFVYYLQTLTDKVYTLKVPNVSSFEIQVSKNGSVFTVINHQHYKTFVETITLSKIKDLIKDKYFSDVNTNQLFLLDLRF